MAQVKTILIFLTNFSQSLINYSKPPTSIGVDFNATLENQLDRTSVANLPKTSKTSMVIKRYMAELICNIAIFGASTTHPSGNLPTAPQFTELPPTLNILINNLLTTQKLNAKMYPISISDHSPITLQVNISHRGFTAPHR